MATKCDPLHTKADLPDDLSHLVTRWLSWDPNADTKAHIESLVAQGNIKELKDRLGRRIAFGTAGA